MIRALSLDVDGTLYRVRRLRTAWRVRRRRALLVASLAAREKLRHEAPSADGQELLLREAELVRGSFGWELAQAHAQLQTLRADLPELLTRRRRPFRGVQQVLQAAADKGLQLAVLSDYAPTQKLQWLGLGGLPWAAQIAADETGALKPHRRPFERLSEALGIPPREILHIGDREELDIEGALNAGFRVWRFDPNAQTPTQAEWSFGHWGPEVLDRLDSPSPR